MLIIKEMINLWKNLNVNLFYLMFDEFLLLN